MTYFFFCLGGTARAYPFVAGSAVRGTLTRPAASAFRSWRIRMFMETFCSFVRPYLHHLSNSCRSEAGRMTLIRTICSSFGVLAIRKSLDAPDALDNIRNGVYAVN